jgi:membrane associated rhomboid family serine protease
VIARTALGFESSDNLLIGFRKEVLAVNRIAWINVIAGIWLIISAWVLGFQTNLAATWSAVITGIIVGLVALATYFAPASSRRGGEAYRP